MKSMVQTGTIVLSVIILLVVVSLAVFLAQMVHMPGQSFKGELPPLTAAEEESSRLLIKHVQMLAGQIGERNWRTHDNLDLAAQYIEMSLSQLRYSTRTQPFHALGEKYCNVEAEIKGSSRPEEIIVVGAHYDSVTGCPAANDNGSGVAAMLEIARLLAGKTPARTVRFVAFANEEPPFFHTEHMGSSHYARLCKSRGDKVVAMLSLETLGFYSDKPGSQDYPVPFSFIYPNQGNFIAFVGNLHSGELLRESLGFFRKHTDFPSEGVSAPEWIPGIDWSDQLNFWQEGYPGLMITDSAPYRYPHYHTADDTPDKLDYNRTARVVLGLATTIEHLASGEQLRFLGRNKK